MERHHWEEVRQECHALLGWAIGEICDMTGLEPLYPLDSGYYAQMGVAPLPLIKDLPAFGRSLYYDCHIVAPVFQWNGRFVARISVQGYNTKADLKALIKALKLLLKEDALRQA
jgi:isopenicillin-N epimerase